MHIQTCRAVYPSPSKGELDGTCTPPGCLLACHNICFQFAEPRQKHLHARIQRLFWAVYLVHVLAFEIGSGSFWGGYSESWPNVCVSRVAGLYARCLVKRKLGDTRAVLGCSRIRIRGPNKNERLHVQKPAGNVCISRVIGRCTPII